MIEIDLKQAIGDIKALFLEPVERVSADKPFFLIVGAGVSYPSIPLAAGIIECCRERLQELNLDLPADTPNPLERYERYFQAAYTHKKSRQEFLSGLIKTKPIPAATFRLAHLLGTGKFTNLVFTPNFDDLLSRALRLLGYDDFVTCDHPKTTSRINPASRQLHLIHVHGVHWFYDCRNLRHEIAGRSAGADDGESMRDRLDEVLRSRSPIVVGYSGWEDDVIMQALRQRIAGKDLPYNLYWFCYKRADAQSLPEWLTDHEDVRLVLPPTAPSSPGQFGGANGSAGVLRAIQPSLSAEEEPSREPVLPALSVFDALITALQLQQPDLTSDPLGFFASRLENSLYLDDFEPGVDLYGLRDVLRRVRAAANLAREQIDALEKVRTAVRTAAYSEASAAAREINLKMLDTRASEDLEAILEQIYLALADSDPTAGLEVCVIRSEIAENNLRLDEKGASWALRVAKALHGQSYCLTKLNRKEEALNKCNQIVDRFEDTENPILLDRIARALNYRGVLQGESDKGTEAVATFEEVVNRFGGSAEIGLREQVARALFNRGVSLAGQGDRREDAIASYDEVMRRFGDSTEIGLREQVARALFNKGGSLAGQGDRREDAIAIYDEVVRRFGDSAEVGLRELVAQALFNKGSLAAKEGRTEDAIASYDEVVCRFGDSAEIGLREPVARALVAQGLSLAVQDGRFGDAIAIYDEVVRRFGDSVEIGLRERVTQALIAKGLSLAAQGGRAEEAIGTYRQAIALSPDRADLWKNLAGALIAFGHSTAEPTVWKEALEAAQRAASLGGGRYNIACCLALTGSMDEALEELRDCLARGDISREHVAQDRDWDDVRADSRFLELLGAAGS